MEGANTQPNISIQARVFRISWDKKPGWIPRMVWLWLGKKRISWTGRWENLGEIANSQNGTAEIRER